MTTTVSFPGLGIGEFSFDRVAFELFGKPIYWYGVIIMLGIVAAFVHANIRCKQEGVSTDDILDVGIFTVLFGVIGARLYYVLTTLDEYDYNSFIDVIAVWEGGLAIYGGILAGGTAVIVTCLYKKLNPLKVADTVAPGVGLAQAIGRWGNFMNGEAYGYEVAEGSLLYPFRMGLLSDYTGAEMKYYHPTFLYESLWNVVGFVLITFLYRKKKFNGQVALMYLAWYGFGRMFIEGLRTDSLYVGPFRISQVVGLLCFAVSAALLIVGLLLTHKGKMPSIFAVSFVTATASKGETSSTSEAANGEAANGEATNGEATSGEATSGEAAAESEDTTDAAVPDPTDGEERG